MIDDETKQSTQEKLFDFIAKCVAEFIKEQNITKKLPLGFTFSFPVHQTSLISGTLIRWTKDFTATGAEGNDVVLMLRDAFQRRQVWGGEGVIEALPEGGVVVVCEHTFHQEGALLCQTILFPCWCC